MRGDRPAILGGRPVIDSAIPPYNSIGLEEEAAVGRVVNSSRLSLFHGSWGPSFLGGPEVQAFEQEWASAFDVPYAVSMNSATSGLIAAVGAVGVGPGDEVIVSPYTM